MPSALALVRLFDSTICSILADSLIRSRWVVLQLAELEKCSSQDEIDERLAKLPEGLDQIYNGILKYIDKEHDELDAFDWFFEGERFRVSFITLKYILSIVIIATLAVILGISHASRRNAQVCTFLVFVFKTSPDIFTARG